MTHLLYGRKTMGNLNAHTVGTCLTKWQLRWRLVLCVVSLPWKTELGKTWDIWCPEPNLVDNGTNGIPT
jgi:hypothetical protein